MQPDISEIFGFYPDLFLQNLGGYSPYHAFYMLLHVYIKSYKAIGEYAYI